MTVTPLKPDVFFGRVSETDAPVTDARPSLGRAFERAVAAAGAAFDRADASEAAFVAGHGSVLAMSIDRAQADVVLSVASAAASRAAQAVTTIFNMQV